MIRTLAIGLLLGLLAGCSRPQAGGELRYTVRDEFGERSSRDRDSVQKTLGMKRDQIKAWVNESPAGEDRKMVEEGANGATAVIITCRNERASVSSRESSITSVLQKSDEEIMKWVTDENGAKENRSASFPRDGHVEIVWRGSGGQLLFTVRNEMGSCTSRDRDSALSTLGKSQDQIRAWAEKGASESRCATLIMMGHVQGISHGVLEDPPWQQ